MLVALPIILPLIVLTLLLLSWNNIAIKQVIHFTGLIAYVLMIGFITAHCWPLGYVTLHVGGFSPPFAISLMIDRFALLMLIMLALTSLLVGAYLPSETPLKKAKLGIYPAFWTLILGVSGAVITADFFNLYVWFEIMMIASFIMLTIGERKEQLNGAVKYVLLNIIATSVILFAVALIYRLTGSLNYAAIAAYAQHAHNQALLIAFCLMLFFALLAKAGFFPLYFWLPAAYPNSYAATGAYLGGMLSKVTVFIIIRLCLLLFPHQLHFFTPLLLTVGCLSMVIGVLSAASQFNFKRILSFHIVSQVGYMLVALAFDTRLAIIGAIYFLLHNILSKTNLFMVSGVCQRMYGTIDLKSLGGLAKRSPLLAISFFISAYSLAGLPPLPGFWGKLLIIMAGLHAHFYVVTAIAVVVSFFTLYSMTKIWRYVFWGNKVEVKSEAPSGLVWPIMVFAALMLILGFVPAISIHWVGQAADQLMHPVGYIHAMLGSQ